MLYVTEQWAILHSSFLIISLSFDKHGYYYLLHIYFGIPEKAAAVNKSIFDIASFPF